MLQYKVHLPMDFFRGADTGVHLLTAPHSVVGVEKDEEASEVQTTPSSRVLPGFEQELSLMPVTPAS